MNNANGMEPEDKRYAALSPAGKAAHDAALIAHRRMLGLAPMPVLSLWEPWASLMMAGFKVHETRHWPTKVRGPFGLHAAKRVDVAGAPADLCNFALGKGWEKTRPVGKLLGVANLTDCIPTEELWDAATAADQVAGNFAKGRFAFRCEDVRPLAEPIPLLGRQGFFNWTAPDDLGQRLLPPVGHLRQAIRWEEQLPS